MEPEKVFTDSFITEDSDGRKVNVTRKISSRKVKRIIYLEQVCYFFQNVKLNIKFYQFYMCRKVQIVS